MEDVSGLYFSQLPEWVRDRIKDHNLTIYYYEGMTEAEIREFFRRLNNGKPLSAIELTRANVPSLAVFQQLAKHKAIQFVVSEAGRKRFMDEMIAMQLYQLITEESLDFSAKPFREWASKVEVDSKVLDTIGSGLDRCAIRVYSSGTVKNYPNRVGFRILACAIPETGPIGNYFTTFLPKLRDALVNPGP